MKKITIFLIIFVHISFILYPYTSHCQEPVHLGEVKLKRSNSNILNELEKEAEELKRRKAELEIEELMYLDQQEKLLEAEREKIKQTGPQPAIEMIPFEEAIAPEVIPSAFEVIPRVQPKIPEGPIDLTTAVEIAMSNYLPARVALEEIELAKLKRGEAKRALFPTASLKATSTDGEALGTQFQERSYGMQIEQPIYYGGRLRNAIRQAEVGLSLSDRKYYKVIADFYYEVSESYFGLITAKQNLKLQEKLLEEAKKDLDIAKKKFAKGLITESELLNVESQIIQAEYQFASAQKDIELARLEFFNRLSLDEKQKIDLPDEAAFDKNLIIEKDDTLSLAFANRPEIQINQLQVEFNRYEEQIARGKDRLKVDFSGFLGESAAAYKTERLDYQSDWFVGLKATLPFGKNTSGYSFQTNKTSKKLGQSDRTRTSSHSVEMGLLNNYATKSEIKSAQIGYDKAVADLDQIKKEVTEEVNDAYFEYQKAKLQVESATKKIQFRKEQLKIIEARAKLNEAMTSEVLEARIKLADEETLRMQAISSFNISLSKINKAIGVPNYYK